MPDFSAKLHQVQFRFRVESIQRRNPLYTASQRLEPSIVEARAYRPPLEQAGLMVILAGEPLTVGQGKTTDHNSTHGNITN